MLYQLGPLQFEVYPLNVHEVTHSTQTDFAEKPVIGSRKGLEFVGEGDETLVLRGRLFPRKLGGLMHLESLDMLRKAAVPQFLMRGDGRPFGWFIVNSISRHHTDIDAQGVGQVIELEISCTRCALPAPTSILGSFMRLFG